MTVQARDEAVSIKRSRSIVKEFQSVYMIAQVYAQALLTFPLGRICD